MDGGRRVFSAQHSTAVLGQPHPRAGDLALIGLTALLVGGVGVGNAVGNYLAGRMETIATLKCVGASGGTIFGVYLIQILAMAAVGIAIARIWIR